MVYRLIKRKDHKAQDFVVKMVKTIQTLGIQREGNFIPGEIGSGFIGKGMHGNPIEVLEPINGRER